MFGFLKKLFKRFKRKKIVRKVLEEGEIANLPKEVELGRGYDKGQIAKRDVQIAKLKEQMKAPEVNISEKLYKQQQALFWNQFQRAFSLRRFFYYNMFKRKKFKVLSHNFKKDFGLFHDLIILKDGRWALVVDNGGEIKPLFTAPTMKEMFRNFGGLSDLAGRGVFVVNLDEKGRYVPNVLEQDVPRVMVDAKGKIALNRQSRKPFIEQLTDAQAEIDEQQNYIETAEDTIREQTGEINRQKLMGKFNKSRATSTEAELTENVKAVENIMKGYRDITKENIQLGLGKSIDHERAEMLENVRNDIIKKMEDTFTKTGVEVAESKYEDIADWVLNLVLPALGERRLMPEKVSVPEEKSKLERRYEK